MFYSVVTTCSLPYSKMISVALKLNKNYDSSLFLTYKSLYDFSPYLNILSLHIKSVMYAFVVQHLG